MSYENGITLCPLANELTELLANHATQQLLFMFGMELFIYIVAYFAINHLNVVKCLQE